MPPKRSITKPSTPTTLNRIKIITSTAATYVVLDTDLIIMFDTTVNVDVVLPATVVNRQLFIKQLAKSKKIVIEANGTELIDGDSTVTINKQYDAVFIFSDGNNWFIV